MLVTYGFCDSRSLEFTELDWIRGLFSGTGVLPITPYSELLGLSTFVNQPDCCVRSSCAVVLLVVVGSGGVGHDVVESPKHSLALTAYVSSGMR